MTTMEKLRAAAVSLRAVIPARGGPHLEAVAVALEALADEAAVAAALRAAETARATVSGPIFATQPKEIAEEKPAKPAKPAKVKQKRPKGGG